MFRHVLLDQLVIEPHFKINTNHLQLCVCGNDV